MKRLSVLRVALLASLVFTINCGQRDNEIIAKDTSETNQKDMVANFSTPSPVPIEKVVYQIPQTDEKWIVREMRHLGIKLKLPPDFTGDVHSWQPTRFWKEYNIEKDNSGYSQIKITVMASSIDEKGSKKSFRQLSQRHKLEFIFNLNKNNERNKKPITYSKNGIKGFLLRKNLDNNLCHLEWITYRYFKDFDPFTETDRFEMRSFVLNIVGPKEDLSQMMQIIDSLEFIGKKENYLSIKK